MQAELCLPSELTIYTVTELRQQWLSLLNSSQDGSALSATSAADAGDATASPAYFTVDAGPVIEVDSAGVQLLLALSNELAGMRQTLLLLNQSAPLIDALSALGWRALLAQPAEPEALQ
jgi:ABC-type transporter Mla MlaB component